MNGPVSRRTIQCRTELFDSDAVNYAEVDCLEAAVGWLRSKQAHGDGFTVQGVALCYEDDGSACVSLTIEEV